MLWTLVIWLSLIVCYDNITSFYTILYMNSENTKAFLKEAYRVLKPNGLLWIWDTNIPCLNENNIFIVPLEIKLNTISIVSTGYGIGWSKEQTAASLRNHITDIDFVIEKEEIFDNHFQFCCRRI